jgi:DNA polymerase-1
LGEGIIAAKEPDKKLVVIDGKSIFYRGYYAMPGLTTSDGTPTGGVYGFTTLSLEVIKKLKPDYVAVAWDKPKTNIRSRLKIYPQYKAGRKPAPPDFYDQIPILHELLESFGWPLYEFDDFEADDIMATLAEQARSKNIETILITSDLDVLQCINGYVKVYALKKGFSNIEEFHPESFKAKYGIDPHQFLDLKSLKGDSSDNIPGVPGIGEKTALELLKKYGNLEEIYKNIDLISGKVHDKLVKGKDKALLSKKLATLFTDAPVKLDLKAMDVDKFDTNRLKANLEKLEFRSLLRQMPQISQIASEIADDTAPRGKLKMPRAVSAKDFEIKKDTELYVHSFCKDAHCLEPYAFILASDGKVATFSLPSDLKELKKLTEDLNDITMVGYDVKQHIKSFISIGLSQTVRVSHDVKVAAFLLDSLHAPKTLHDLAAAEIDYDHIDIADIPPEDMPSYAPELMGVLQAIQAKQLGRMKKLPKLSKLAVNIEWPVIPVLAKMELTGIKLDSDYLKHMQTKLNDQISDLEQTIYGYANKEFNISSPQQLAKVLFEDIGLPAQTVKKGKTGYSTAAGELDKLQDLHPIISCIQKYREYTKLKNTYVDALPKLVSKDGRIHTTFNLTVAQTGRLSSTDPNLQNIPVRNELGKSIRKAFVAGKGCVFVSADYSQFELRLAAVMAGDTDMIDVFNSGTDIHTRTAAEIYGIALEDVTPEQRRNAKTINFGVLYGMSPHGLAVATGMSFDEAKEFIDKYFAARQPLVDYINKLKKQAKEKGYVETMFGRRRPTPDVNSGNFIVREAALRQAVNMPMQGTEADLMKMAMVELDKKFTKDFSPKSRPNQLLQIHDSILVECQEKDEKTVEKLMRETMEGIYPNLGVPLDVDIHTGKDWGEL